MPAWWPTPTPGLVWFPQIYGENHFLDSMAEGYTRIYLNIGVDEMARTVIGMVDKYGADGLVLHSNRSCKPYSFGQYDIQRIVQQPGYSDPGDRGGHGGRAELLRKPDRYEDRCLHGDDPGREAPCLKGGRLYPGHRYRFGHDQGVVMGDGRILQTMWPLRATTRSCRPIPLWDPSGEGGTGGGGRHRDRGHGYGRNSAPFAGKAVTEIMCHAAGARYLEPRIRFRHRHRGPGQQGHRHECRGKGNEFCHERQMCRRDGTLPGGHGPGPRGGSGPLRRPVSRSG